VHLLAEALERVGARRAPTFVFTVAGAPAESVDAMLDQPPVEAPGRSSPSSPVPG
jgi:hypothetical protein